MRSGADGRERQGEAGRAGESGPGSLAARASCQPAAVLANIDGAHTVCRSPRGAAVEGSAGCLPLSMQDAGRGINTARKSCPGRLQGSLDGRCR